MRHWRTIAATSGLIAIAYAIGVWSQAAHWPPATFLARVGDPILRLAGRSRLPTDAENETFGRQPVACPAAGERTMVALVFGQSQAANQVRERFVGGSQVFNYFRGHCYEAVDPLLGTGGDKGNVWTLIGTELVEQKRFDAVVLVTIAIGGASIAEWAPGGKLHGHLMSALTAITPAFFTHVFIAQGETDFLSGELFPAVCRVDRVAAAKRGEGADFRRHRVRLLRHRGNAAEARQSDRRGPEARDRHPGRGVLRGRHGRRAQRRFRPI
jgi:hypothetical protein